MISYSRLLALLLLLVLLTGCASNRSVPESEMGQFRPTQQVDRMVDNRLDIEPVPLDEAGTASGLTAAGSFVLDTPFDNRGGQVARPSDDYRIGPQDLLEITVFGVPELSTTVRVSATGFVTMPLIGLVDANGLTAAELEERVTARLARDYMQDPKVTVYITEFASQQVTMEGAVGRPGIYKMSGRTSLLQALALAGGLGSLADPETVRIFRENEQGERMVGMFDIDKIRRGEAPDPQLKGNDVVVVARNDQRAFLRDSLFRDTIDVIFNPFRMIRP